VNVILKSNPQLQRNHVEYILSYVHHFHENKLNNAKP
jgi:hypothetical protein